MIRTAHAVGLLMGGLLLSACGGGCGDCHASNEGPTGQATATCVSSTDAARQEATRFLTQATFGPTPQDVDHLLAIGQAAWLDEQFAMPTTAISHVQHWDTADQHVQAARPGQHASSGEVVGSFLREALSSPDQLRQRVAFALSEIFVVSLRDSCGDGFYARGAAGYLDMLGQQAFGTYRNLLEQVTLHPVMGCYLSHMKNRPADPATGRVPDENFAREIMQLFSIGLVALQPDGTPRRNAQGDTIDTYGPADIAGLAAVFTGWSWWCPGAFNVACFNVDPYVPQQYVTPMRAYGAYHDQSDKRFLGQHIPASLFNTAAGDLQRALDTLAAHPNVGPFIGRQLIQRLVTSNPSPAYVGRVAQAFGRSGGSLREVVKAVLLDPEARDPASWCGAQYGKVREPLLRLTALARAVGVQSDTGRFLVTNLGDPGAALGQTPLSAPSVFNFFRPDFRAPGSRMAQAGLLAPELQLATESAVAEHLNFMQQVLTWGMGWSGDDGQGPRQDVQLAFNTDPAHPLLGLTHQPDALVAELDRRLTYGTLPAATAQIVAQAVAALPDGGEGVAASDAALAAQRRRLRTALLLLVASPEFQVQR